MNNEKKSYAGGGAAWAVIGFVVFVILCVASMPFVFTAWMR